MSEYTDYGITIPTDGSDFNLWGGILNEETFPLLFKLVTGIEAISLTGNVTLTSTNGLDNQSRNLALNFSDGGLASIPTVTIPGVEKVYIVNNGGATYSITFSAGGTTASIEAGYWGILLCDGTNCTMLSLSALVGNEIGDNLFRVKGSADATKKVAFEVDGLTTATTRTVTVPDASGTMMYTSAIGVTVQGYDADTAKTDVDQSWTGAQRSASGTTLTSATTITPVLLDWEGNRAGLTLAHNATIANPSDIASAVGYVGRIVGAQDGTGGRTLAFGNQWFPVGAATAPAAPDGISEKFRIDFEVVSSTRIDFSLSSVGV